MGMSLDLPGKKTREFLSLSLRAHAARGIKLVRHDKQGLQPCFHAVLYRGLIKLVFSQLPRLRFSGTFDMLWRTCS